LYLVGDDVSLTDPHQKNEKTKYLGFYECLALSHLRPLSYTGCESLPYDLYCPSVPLDDDGYVCPYKKCRKICTTKDLLSLHLRATQHHSYVEDAPTPDELDLEESAPEIINVIDDVTKVPDGPCVIEDFRIFLSSTWEVTYE
jgi:hypothetical protein